ncbi:hypothetical protein [Paraburkholderia sp. 2C]
MDRRTFIATGTWYSTGAWLPAWFTVGSAEARGAASSEASRDGATLACATRCFAVLDASLAHADAFADHAARRSIPVFEIGNDHDIGTLWHVSLAASVARAPSSTLIGFTRASDFFVLTRLALRPGRLVASATEMSRPHANAPVSFVISV